MKTIGLIGGMSWESTLEYYRIINEDIQKQLGGLHSAKCLLYSVNFETIERYQIEGEWEKAGSLLSEVAHTLEIAGADFIIICTNTMHKVIQHIEKNISIPIIHIADATAKQIKKQNIITIGLLGTAYTMEQNFYKKRIQSYGIETIIPAPSERNIIDKIIFEELCLGKITQSSKNVYLEIINNLIKQGAEAIVLGCTEIGLLIKSEDVDIPLFDTTAIHAKEAVKQARS